MAYPPDFDQTWDITAPLDSSAANLIGQDIRNLTNEVMQRMALLSGVVANRPTPETVNATWGGSGYGILFFSTDEKKVYQWNGAAWVDVSFFLPGGSGLIFSGGGVTLPADTAVHTVYTGTIPANSLGTTGVFDFDLMTNLATGSNIPLIEIDFEPAGVVIDLWNFALNVPMRIFGSMVNTDATHQAFYYSYLQDSASGSNPYSAPLNIDTTVDQTVSIKAQKADSGDLLSFIAGHAEVIS